MTFHHPFPHTSSVPLISLTQHHSAQASSSASQSSRRNDVVKSGRRIADSFSLFPGSRTHTGCTRAGVLLGGVLDRRTVRGDTFWSDDEMRAHREVAVHTLALGETGDVGHLHVGESPHGYPAPARLGSREESDTHRRTERGVGHWLAVSENRSIRSRIRPCPPSEPIQRHGRSQVVLSHLDEHGLQRKPRTQARPSSDCGGDAEFNANTTDRRDLFQKCIGFSARSPSGERSSAAE